MRIAVLLVVALACGCTRFNATAPVRTSYVEYPARPADATLELYDAARPPPAELKEFAVYRYRFDAADREGQDRFRTQAKHFALEYGAEALDYQVEPDGKRVVLTAHLLHR